MTTTTQPHDSLTCNRDNGRACTMCRWANKRRRLIECPGCFEWRAAEATHVCGVRAAQPDLRLPDYIRDIRACNEANGLREFFESESGRCESEQAEPAPSHSCAHCLPGIDCGCPCHNAALATMADNGPPSNFESAWATAPPEYSRYTEESHALYWYLRGMQDEQRITRIARQSLAQEDVEEMLRLAQVRRER